MILLKDITGAVNLQATLKSSTVPGLVTEPVHPHHPITCSSGLRLERDQAFSCEHATVPAGDGRTQACLDLSLAILLIELAQAL
jgi:hypothetical protein